MGNKFELTLIITENCNLQCSYCFCNKNMHNEMSVNTAQKAIEQQYQKCKEQNQQLYVLFFGGEPFLNFKLIKECVAYTETHAMQNIRFKTVTNGTLLTPEIQKWLWQHRQTFETAISMDGQPATHDYHRCDSFGRINLEFARKSGCTIKMVVSPDTVFQLAENVIYFNEQGLYVQCEIADGVDWSPDSLHYIFAKELLKLTDYYLHHPDKYPVPMLTAGFHHLSSSQPVKHCSPGITSLTIDTQGKQFACQRCTPYYNNGAWQIPADHLSLAFSVSLLTACSSCCAAKLCNACPATIASLSNNPEQAKARCKMLKICHLASANLLLQLITNCPEHIYLRHRSIQQIQAMATGARKILTELTI